MLIRPVPLEQATAYQQDTAAALALLAGGALDADRPVRRRQPSEVEPLPPAFELECVDGVVLVTRADRFRQPCGATLRADELRPGHAVPGRGKVLRVTRLAVSS